MFCCIISVKLLNADTMYRLACVASVSVRFRSKERGTRVKDSCFISRAAKTENPVPRSFFAPKPNGNACYAGYVSTAYTD